MAVNKVVFGAVSIMDISDSTVTPDKLAKGEVAYGADGERIVGTMEAGGGSDGGETLKTCTVIIQIVRQVSTGKYWMDYTYAVSYCTLVDGVKTETEARLVKGVDYTMVGATQPKFTLDCVCGTRVFSALSDLVGIEYTIDVPEEIDDFQFLRSTSDPATNIYAMGYVFTTPKEPGTYTITITY